MFRYFSYIICLQNASLHNVQKIILTSTARMKINKYKKFRQYTWQSNTTTTNTILSVKQSETVIQIG